MILGKIKTSIVIIIAVISLVGLGWIQYNWLQDSIKTNKEIFEQKIDLVSGLVKKALDDTPKLQQLINDDLVKTHIISDTTDYKLRAFVDSVMYNGCGLRTSFEYGIYTHTENKTNAFSKMAGIEVPINLDFQECSANTIRNFGWISFSPSQRMSLNPGSPSHYHLGIFYQTDPFYLISQMRETLIAAIVFMILLSTSFSYTLLTIRKQKKISTLKNDFINNLTHEFKTPIFSIDLAASMLKRAPELANNKKLINYAAIIMSEGERLKSQVDKVLQMAIVDSDNFKLEKKLLDIHEIILRVTRNFEILIKERFGKISLNLKATKTHLFADETHLKNIIYNLLDNAQKYSPNIPIITITTMDNEDGLILEIEDNGIGMNDQVQKYVFDRFYRANTDVIQVSGFGLGLSYVKSVIDAHKASIKLISTPNQGSKFTLQFRA